MGVHFWWDMFNMFKSFKIHYAVTLGCEREYWYIVDNASVNIIYWILLKNTFLTV